MVNSDWKDAGIASVIVMRRHSNGHITAGFYLTDLLAKGVKDTHFVFNEPEQEIYDRLPENLDIEEIKYELVTFISDALFRKWLDKHHPVGPGIAPSESMKNARISFQPLDLDYKDDQEGKDMEEVYIAMQEPHLPKWKISSIENRIRQIMTRNPDNPIGHNCLPILLFIHQFPDRPYNKRQIFFQVWNVFG